MEFKTIDDMGVRDVASFSKTISESDVYLFAGITGDLNPAHVNAEYMRTTSFKQRIAHSGLTVGLISTVIGTTLPGPGCIIVSYSAKFIAPVYFGDTITAKVQITKKDVDKNRLKLRAMCLNQRGDTVVSGEFIVSPYVRKIAI